MACWKYKIHYKAPIRFETRMGALLLKKFKSYTSAKKILFPFIHYLIIKKIETGKK